MKELEFQVEAEGIVRVQEKQGIGVGTLVLGSNGEWTICLGLGKMMSVETLRQIVAFVESQTPNDGKDRSC